MGYIKSHTEQHITPKSSLNYAVREQLEIYGSQKAKWLEDIWITFPMNLSMKCTTLQCLQNLDRTKKHSQHWNVLKLRSINLRCPCRSMNTAIDSDPRICRNMLRAPQEWSQLGDKSSSPTTEVISVVIIKKPQEPINSQNQDISLAGENQLWTVAHRRDNQSQGTFKEMNISVHAVHNF